MHDDWRVSSRLTLNLGLRYDVELGMTEAENRAVRAFDLTTANPIQAAAQAAYAASAPAGVPLSAADSAAASAAGTRICRPTHRACGAPTGTTCSRGSASPTR